MGSCRPGISLATAQKQNLLRLFVKAQLPSCINIIAKPNHASWVYPELLCVDLTAGYGCQPFCHKAYLNCKGPCPQIKTSSPFIIAKQLASPMRHPDIRRRLILCEKQKETISVLDANTRMMQRTIGNDAFTIDVYPGDLNKSLRELLRILSRTCSHPRRQLFGFAYLDPNGFDNIDRRYEALIEFFNASFTRRFDLLINWSPTAQKRCNAAFAKKFSYDLAREIEVFQRKIGKSAARFIRVSKSDPHQFSLVLLTNWNGGNGKKQHPILRERLWSEPWSKEGQQKLWEQNINRLREATDG